MAWVLRWFDDSTDELVRERRLVAPDPGSWPVIIPPRQSLFLDFDVDEQVFISQPTQIRNMTYESTYIPKALTKPNKARRS